MDLCDFDNRPGTGILARTRFAVTATSRAFRFLDPARAIARGAGGIE